VCTDLFFLIIYFVVGVLVIRFLFSDGDIDLIENCAKEAGTGSVRSSAFRVRSVGRCLGRPRDGQFVGVQ
jgi:hypothetical protein